MVPSDYIQLLRGRPAPRGRMPVCRDPILPPPLPKTPNWPINSRASTHLPPRIEDEPIDVDSMELELNTDFGEKPRNRKELYMKYKKDQERNTCMKLINCKHR